MRQNTMRTKRGLCGFRRSIMMSRRRWSRSAPWGICGKTLTVLQEYFTAIGVKMHMYLVDEAALGAIRPDPERYEVLEDRDSFDYIYSGEEMLCPSRKKIFKNEKPDFAIPSGLWGNGRVCDPESGG